MSKANLAWFKLGNFSKIFVKTFEQRLISWAAILAVLKYLKMNLFYTVGCFLCFGWFADKSEVLVWKILFKTSHKFNIRNSGRAVPQD